MSSRRSRTPKFALPRRRRQIWFTQTSTTTTVFLAERSARIVKTKPFEHRMSFRRASRHPPAKVGTWSTTTSSSRHRGRPLTLHTDPSIAVSPPRDLCPQNPAISVKRYQSTLAPEPVSFILFNRPGPVPDLRYAITTFVRTAILSEARGIFIALVLRPRP